MNPELEKLLHEERQRVFQPDSYFAERMVARFRTESFSSRPIWEMIPAATRPVFALALTLLLAFLTVEAFVPAAPRRGFVEAFIDPEQSAAENVLYTDSDAPASRELLEQLIVLEEGANDSER